MDQLSIYTKHSGKFLSSLEEKDWQSLRPGWMKVSPHTNPQSSGPKSTGWEMFSSSKRSKTREAALTGMTLLAFWVTKNIESVGDAVLLLTAGSKVV